MRFCILFFYQAGEKKTAPLFSGAAFICLGKLDGTLNLVGTQTSGTSVHMAGGAVDNRLDTLYIGLPCTVGTSVGVGDLDTKGNALATIITLSHSLHLLSLVT